MDGAGEVFQSLGETWPGNQVLISMNDDHRILIGAQLLQFFEETLKRPAGAAQLLEIARVKPPA